MDTVRIRPLTTLNEMRGAVELQDSFWGSESIPAHMLVSLVNYGGHVVGAWDDERLVGVLIGFLGTNIEESERPAMANLLLASKRMVVLPDYRGRGIGYRLKLEQRRLALKQGVRLVMWTFDPLAARNAYLNIHKLGAVSRVYRRDYYGAEAGGGLATLGASDRLLAEWWVTNRRVEERINGDRATLGLKQYLDANATILNPSQLTNGDFPEPPETVVASVGPFTLLEVPLDYSAIVQQDTELGHRWRLHTRGLFAEMLKRDYIVTDFIREAHEGRQRGFYLLSRTNPQMDFSLN